MKLKNKDISVCVWSGDYETLAKWYADVLGFVPIRHLTHPKDTVIDFDFAPTFFSVGKHDRVTGSNRDPHRIMIGFNVDSVSEAYEELKNKSVTWIATPFEAPTGGFWCMTIADPEGNILQFFGQK